MCIIRQLINQHSIIDSYPMMALVDKTTDHAPRKPQRRQDDPAAGDTDPPTDESDSSSYDDEDDTSVLSDMEPFPTKMVAPAPATAAAPVMSDRIAQDVLVFKKIAEMMPPQSLLHLLKADVLVNVDATTEATSAPVIEAQNQVEKEAHREERPAKGGQVLAPYRASKVRFAQNKQGKLLRHTRFFEPVRNKSLWWQKEEMEEIRAECCSLVEDYTLYKKNFEADLTTLMECANEANLKDYDENELKCFDTHQVARGLERHIVLEFESLKQFHFEAIMSAQHEYRKRGTTERWKHIKRTSLAASLPTRYISVRFAQNDQAIVRREMASEEEPVVSPRHRRQGLTRSSRTSSNRKLRNFIKRTVSRRFTATG